MSQPLRVLVAEDEPLIRALVTMAFEAEGYDVETAISSVEAIQALKRRDFDLMLCDYSLEQEHTGFEVINYGRRKDAKAKAAILTGYASKETAEEARRQGIAILYKPIDIEEFFSTIDKLLREEYEPHKTSEEEGGEPGSGKEGTGPKGSPQPRAGRRSRAV